MGFEFPGFRSLTRKMQMMYEVPEFVIEQAFHKIVREEDGFVTFWRTVKEQGEGYIVYWPSQSECHHTYAWPPYIWG